MKKICLLIFIILNFIACNNLEKEEKTKAYICQELKNYTGDNFWFIIGLDRERSFGTEVKYRGIIYSDRLQKIHWNEGVEIGLTSLDNLNIKYIAYKYASLIKSTRIESIIMMLSGYALMTGIVINSYLHFRKNLKRLTTEKMLSMHHAETIDIMIYLIIFLWTMISNFIDSLWPRILTNVFMTIMIVRTYVIYSRFIYYSLELSKMNIIIPEKIEKLMGQHTENPFYTSNPTLEAISQALDIEKEDLRNYIYTQLETTLSAWASEKRILYISQQLLKTDRMVSELALSCGYSNPSALNRAFKQHFGVTPSEFRVKNKL